MTFDRRSLLALGAPAAAALVLTAAPGAALAQAGAAAADPRMADRALGRPDAPVTVIEYFSLTCGHCAAFHQQTWPRVREELVETGRVRHVFRDFPLDGVALMAAMVARALPPERYEPFVAALFANQDRWAFARGSSPQEELARMAALAGMPRATFDATVADEGLRRAILEARLRAEQEHRVNSTPTFVFNNRVVPGNMPFERFAELVAEAS